MTVDAINLLRCHFREIKWEYLPPFCSTMMSSPSTVLLQWQRRWFRLTRSTNRTGRSDVAAVTSCLHWRALWIQQHSRLRSLWEWRFELVTHPALKKQRKIKKKEKRFWWGHLESEKWELQNYLKTTFDTRRCTDVTWNPVVELVFACNVPEQSAIIFSEALTGSLWPRGETQDVTLLNPLAYL